MAAAKPPPPRTPARRATRPTVAALLRRLRFYDQPACAESVLWAKGYGADWRKAWAECPELDWLLYFLSAIGLDPELYHTAARAADLAWDREWDISHDSSSAVAAGAAAIRVAVPYAAVARAARRAWKARGGKAK